MIKTRGALLVLVAGLLVNTPIVLAGAKKPAVSADELQPARNDLEMDPAFQAKMDQLLTSSKGWSSLTYQEKLKAIDLVINLFKVKENAAILKPVEHYSQRVDVSFSKDPSMATLPLTLVIKILSVMEFDFYNGQDKQALARQTLGPDFFEQGEKRTTQ